MFKLGKVLSGVGLTGWEDWRDKVIGAGEKKDSTDPVHPPPQDGRERRRERKMEGERREGGMEEKREGGVQGGRGEQAPGISALPHDDSHGGSEDFLSL